MPSNKTESGLPNVECVAFPPLSINKELLKDKSCYMVEPYDDNRLLSVFVLKNKDGFIMKILDQDGKHIDPNDAAPMEKELITALNINMHLKVKQSQLFFAIKDAGPVLVDVFDGKNFISPGMLNDIYGKRMKTQTIKSIEKYDPNKEYGAIIKPKIICLSDNKPIYVKG